jgi:LuxR family maltose regulon positive regulatory protein
VSAGEFEVAGVLDRPRLFAVLDSPRVRVCIVKGPSGSGKTTLLRSWALKQRERLTWVTLGDGGISRQAFWRHVVGSAQRHGDLSTDMAAQVFEQLDRRADPVRIAVELFQDAGAVTLVIDAYEHLGDAAPEIDQDLAQLLTALPGLRVLITTRSGTALADADPPGGTAQIITLDELALTPDEVGTLIAQQIGIADERLALSVMHATRGFALTVRAVMLALSQLGRIPHVDSIEWNSMVAARWESLLPDDVPLRFVTDTSVPPYVDIELATNLTGHPDARGLLDLLERNGFGRWIPYARQRPVFQYAEIIRDTFRARAAADTDRFSVACASTARWLFDNGEVDQALAFAIEGGDYALADRTFVSLVVGNPDSYITDRFLPVLRRVPDEMLVRYPMLAFGLGLALAANSLLRLDAPRAFRIAIESPAQPAYLEPSIDAFTLAAMRAVARRTAFAFRESADAALTVVRSVDEIPAELRAQFGEHLGTILRQLSYSLLQGGMIDDAIATAVRSVSLCTTQTARNYSVVYAVGATAFAGDLSRSRTFSASIDAAAWPENLHRTYMNALGVVAEGYQHLDALDFAGAADALRGTDAYTTTGEFWPFFTGISVAARHGLGQARAEAERVTRELAASRMPGTGDNAATEHLHATLARAWLAGGDHRAAGRLLDAQPPERPFLAAARVDRLLAEERAGDALTLAEASLELPAHTLRTRSDLWTSGAVAALRRNRPELAWSWLTSAALCWESYGPRMHVALLPARDRRLVVELAEQHHSTSVLRYLEVPTVAGQASPSAVVSLTPRESVVLRALAVHGSVREIAEALVVSPHTIKSQLQGLYRKLGVTSRRSAVVGAVELGVLGDHTARDTEL